MDIISAFLAKQLAGGGSGGVSSWNDLTDKPFYSEGVKVAEILPETESMVSSEGALISTDVTLDAGATYHIKYNGTDYTCTAQDLSALMPGATAVGNLVMGGHPDTGEPFIIVCNPDMGIMLMDYGVAMSGEDALVTVSIHCNVETIHKLDNKYIDAEWMAVTKDGKPNTLPTKFLTTYINATVDNTNVGEYSLTADAVDKSYPEVVALVQSGVQVAVKLTTTAQEVLFLPLCNYYQGNWLSFATLETSTGSLIKVVSITMSEDGISFLSKVIETQA